MALPDPAPHCGPSAVLDNRDVETTVEPSRSGTASGSNLAEPATVSAWSAVAKAGVVLLERRSSRVVYDRLWRGFVVGLRERILRLLDTDGADLDPDEFVEFAVVKLGAGPLLVERLRQAGIDAHGHETVNPATTMLTDYSVSVRRRDLAAAAEAYNE